jgi:hypothetical protein
MWILKGILVSLGVFFIGTLIYVSTKLGPIEEHKATAISVIIGPTLFNPWWWITLLATLAFSCWFFKMYEPGATTVFEGVLFVFGIFIAALVALIFVSRSVGGVEFPVSSLTRIGMFLIGCAIGSTVLGVGLLWVGRVTAATLAGHLAR